MRILAVGDLVGESAVKKLKEELPKIREEEKIDFVIVNAENSAGGIGITSRNFFGPIKIKRRLYYNGKSYMGKKGYFFIY